MSDLTTFLAWFSGISENIKKQPTPAQWAKIRSKIADLETGAPQSAPVAPAAAPKPAKPRTPAAWRAQYIEALMGLGLDHDSAKDFADTATVDLSRDPAVAAKADSASMLN
jgi:hypothetical protein